MAKLTDAATVLTVRDVAVSTRYYNEALRFSVEFEYGQPASYVGLCRDDAVIHLTSTEITEHQPGQGDVAIFVTGVDAIYSELVARGVAVLMAPESRDYGMRDFSVVDPDGNRITFGEPC